MRLIFCKKYFSNKINNFLKNAYLFLQHPKKKFLIFLLLDLLFAFFCSSISCMCLLASVPQSNLVIPKYYFE